MSDAGISCSLRDCCSEVALAASAPATPPPPPMIVPPGVAAPARLVSGLTPPSPILGGAAAGAAVGAALIAVMAVEGRAELVATAEVVKGKPRPTAGLEAPNPPKLGRAVDAVVAVALPKDGSDGATLAVGAVPNNDSAADEAVGADPNNDGAAVEAVGAVPNNEGAVDAAGVLPNNEGAAVDPVGAAGVPKEKLILQFSF